MHTGKRRRTANGGEQNAQERAGTKVSGTRVRRRAEAPGAAKALATRPHCAATTVKGLPCPAPPTVRGFCSWHSPDIPEETKQLWRMKGGLHSVQWLPNVVVPPLDSPDVIAAFLRETTQNVLRGAISPAMGATAIAGANAALKCWEISLAKRLAEIEAVLAERARSVPGVVIEEDASEPDE